MRFAWVLCVFVAVVAIGCGRTSNFGNPTSIATSSAPTTALVPTPTQTPPLYSTHSSPGSTQTLLTTLPIQKCGRESILRSGSSLEAATIYFENFTSQVVMVYWLDYGGERHLYSTVPPGVGVEQPTYKGHPWLVTDTAGRCLEIYLPVESQNRAIIKGLTTD